MSAWRVPSWETFEAGAEAAEEIASELGLPLAKAEPRILSTPGYNQAVRTLLRALAKATRGPERAAMAKVAGDLDRNWETMKEAERARVVASAARHILGVPELIVGKVVKSIAESAGEVVRIAKRDMGPVYRLRIDPAFTARDERIVKFAAESQGSYITTRYRERAVAFEQRARDIVSKGVSDGMGRRDIGAILRSSLIDPSLRSSEAYWETVASIHIGRARSWGQLAGFDEAEIEWFEIEAVLDEVTTDQCRFLHGRRFNVAKAIASYQNVEQSDDPEAVKKFQPWLRVGKNDDGDRVLMLDRGTSQRMVAQVHDSGVGTADKVGSYSSSLDEAAMQKLGIHAPPYHPRCRTTIVPA